MNYFTRNLVPLAAAVLLAVAVPKASAQEALDLAAVRQSALDGSATLKNVELALDAALLSRKAQAYQRLPSVSASVSGSYDYESTSSADPLGASAKISVSQSLYTGGRLAALAESSDTAVRAAAEAARSVRVTVLGQADSAYYAVLKAGADVEAAASDLAAANLRLDIAKAKAEAGILAASDYLQAVSEVAGGETTLTKARRSESSARAKLASIAGLSASLEVKPVDFSLYDGLLSRLSALDEEGIERLSAVYIAMAEAKNPDLAGYALAARKATIAVDVARSAYLPTLSLGASQGLSYGPDDGLSLGSGSVSLTGTLSLDLWVTANSVASARNAADRAALDGAEGSRSLRLEIDVAVNDLLSAARSISSSAKALEYSESSYRSVLERFKLSAASASDLSSAEALVSSARTGLIGSRYDFLSALSGLRVLVGLEADEPIVSAIL